MNEALAAAEKLSTYEWGFSSDIEQEFAPKGLSEDTVRFISAKKGEPEWMLDWRLKAYRLWLTMTPPDWAKLNVPPIDYQDAYYYAAPKAKPKLGSLDEVDPEILRVYEKLGIPIDEQKLLAGVEEGPGRAANAVAVDAVFDSVSVATTFRKELEAGRRHLPLDQRGDPRISRSGAQVARQGRAAARQLLRRAQLRGLLGRHLRLHSRGRALPDGAVDLFPHQRREYRPVRAHADRRRQGQLRLLPRRLHRAERDENQLHAAVVELVALDDAEIKYSTVQNWYPGDAEGKGGIYNFVTKRALCQGKQHARCRWTQVETGSAITWKYPRCVLAARTRSANSTRSRSPTTASRPTPAPR